MTAEFIGWYMMRLSVTMESQPAALVSVTVGVSVLSVYVTPLIHVKLSQVS